MFERSKFLERMVTFFQNSLTRKLGTSIIKLRKENLAIGGYSMNKDEVLKMSREENEGRHDEREIIAFGTASRVGMLVGALVCVLLVFASELLFHIPEIGQVGWLVYFAMQGSSNIVLYKDLKNRRNLIWGIIEIAFAVVFAVVLVIRSVV